MPALLGLPYIALTISVLGSIPLLFLLVLLIATLSALVIVYLSIIRLT